jgi:hypothetical protein
MSIMRFFERIADNRVSEVEDLLFDIKGRQPVKLFTDLVRGRRRTHPAAVSTNTLVLRAAQDDYICRTVVVGIETDDLADSRVIRVILGEKQTTIGACRIPEKFAHI